MSYEQAAAAEACQTHGMPQRLLGLFAHPDDELFCVGGTFALAADAGADTRVVSFTQGEAGQIRHATLATRKTLGAVRADELRRSCISLGLGSSRCLSFADGHLHDVPIEQLVAEAVTEIRQFKPDAVYSFDHTGAYGHSDHVTMSKVSVLAAEAAGDPARFPQAGPAFAPGQVLHARFPQNDQLLLEILVQWLIDLPERFRGTDAFTNALMMFADGSSMLGYAADQLGVEWYPKGSYIIEQGAEDRRLYLVLAGSVSIVQESPEGEMLTLGSVGPGEFIGETAIATDQRRSAHCIATENTTCFVLSATATTGYRSAELDADRQPDSPIGAGEDTTNPTAEQNRFTVDVAAAVPKKVDALSQHRTQYAIAPDLFPPAMLSRLLGAEHFAVVWQPPRPDQPPTP